MTQAAEQRHTAGPKVQGDGLDPLTGGFQFIFIDGEKYPARLVGEAPYMAAAGQFLIDRLDEFEREIQSDDLAREWMGHISPALHRFRAAISRATSSEQKGGES